MRRTDRPAVVLPDGDGEGTALPSYADSDMGFTPRSLTPGHGSARSGSLTEEPPPSKWDDSAFARVKLMCSYGGRILPRPHDNQLRYVGGESRIAVVSRGITFSELTAKLSRMFGASITIKYQFPNEELDALISVTSDEDLENMMEEYDRLQSIVGNRFSASARLRVFLFPAKLERSQTASLLETMDTNHSRERWFVDILNGLPVLPHVRSETSSIVSETPDYLFQSNNMDALEEWAAATSYGNSSAPPLTEESPGHKQGNPVSATALFGSLLQPPGSGDVASDPGSPSPLKHTHFMTGSSASAPPAVISLLSAMAEAASSGLSTPMQHVGAASDGSTSAYANKMHLGSGDGSVGVPEQRKHVDSEVLLTSDKGILSSRVTGAEQFLPVGSMDEGDAFQTAKGSFDEVCGSSQSFVEGVHTAEQDEGLKNKLVSEVPTLTGQPIFDEEVLPMSILAQTLKNLQLEEGLSSPVVSPSGKSSPSSAQFSSPTAACTTQQQPLSAAVMSKASGGEPMGTEDKPMQQNLQSVASHVMDDLENGLLRQHVSPSLAHFLPSSIVPQQATMFPNVVGEGILAQQIPGNNATKDVAMPVRPQPLPPVTSDSSPIESSPMAPMLHEELGMRQKLPAGAASNYSHQAQGFEMPMTYIMQVPGVQPPINSQTPVSGAANPLPPVAVPLRAGANLGVATQQATGTSRPQSPRTAMVGGGINPMQHTPHVRAMAGTPVTSPPIVPALGGEEVMGLVPVTTNTSSPSSMLPAMGEGVKGIPATSYPQVEAVNAPRHVSDPLATTPRVAAVSPKVGNQFNVVSFNAQPAPGIPTRFRAVGRPIQPVAEGIPVQQAPAVGAIADKKATPAVQRALTSPSMHAPVGPGGQYSYFMGDQANVSPQLAAIGGTSRYNTPQNVMVGTVAPDAFPFPGANPFVDNFQPAPTYQDGLEVAPADQQQRRQQARRS